MTLTFGRVRKDLALQHVRLHDLRHFVVTELLSAGVDLRTISERVGHKRATTTLGKYAQFLPARDQDAAIIIASKLSG